MEIKKQISKTQRKKYVTLFMIMTPSVLLAASSGISNITVRLIFNIILFSLQLLILKTLFDDFWEE